MEILPLAELKHTPKAPAGIAGLLNYHGASVPVFDLVKFATGEPCRERMNTRILLLPYPLPGGNSVLLGMLAEHVVELVQRPEDDFKSPGILTPEAPYLGDIASDGRDLIQLVTVEKLLPDDLRAYVAEGEASNERRPD